MANQLRDYLHAHGLENSYQSDYKAGHSTETALLLIKNEVHLTLARGKPTALVLLDLSAAFDTIIPHCSIVYSLGLVYVALSSSGLHPI